MCANTYSKTIDQTIQKTSVLAKKDLLKLMELVNAVDVIQAVKRAASSFPHSVPLAIIKKIMKEFSG